jgi:hypothetical protein
LRFGITAAGVKVWYVMAPRSAENKNTIREGSVRKSAQRPKKKSKLPRSG